MLPKVDYVSHNPSFFGQKILCIIYFLFGYIRGIIMGNLNHLAAVVLFFIIIKGEAGIYGKNKRFKSYILL